MTAPAFTAAELRTVDLFDSTTDAELEEWLAVAQPLDVPPGHVLVRQGENPDGVYLMLEGEAQAFVTQGGGYEPVGRQRAPTWMGAIAVITEAPLGVEMRCEKNCRIAMIPPADFRRLALAQPAVHRRVMQQVAPVMSRVTAVEQNRERLASLGTMAAGLAHELNNPVAAARRATAQMAEALEVVSETIGQFVEAGLEELSVPQPWELVEPLATAGVDADWLRRVAAAGGPATAAAIKWVAASLAARGLAAELAESTQRMSALVGAVKTYAYMDRGDLVEIDLHEGIDNTLAVLAHKLKHVSIDVRREYDRSLPKLIVRGSELNQVWTNLIDNAIDALGESGRIQITTRRENGCAIVTVTDDGPGIPPAIRERVFDSFFTTKDVGQGTGLGLATARRIVVDRHDGSLTVDSQPGRTCFRVSLPLKPAERPEPQA